MLLAKSKLNTIEGFISKTLIDSNISHDDLASINDMLKEYCNMKEKIKNVKTESVYWRFFSIYKTMLSYCLKCRKNKESKNLKTVKTKNGRIILVSKYVVYWWQKIKIYQRAKS